MLRYQPKKTILQAKDDIITAQSVAIFVLGFILVLLVIGWLNNGLPVSMW